ncbi:MAG: DUF1015 domain-containing protein, partial [Gammaproteobacteria bacterium]|nr:DUF1015 domain-containing protein [Gammaproteobacteria bacterium]NIR85874.1 DUF1015 domain-containing protein [Gammaproteobacteria bacterium]NIR90841.1 DUF1015 domain-containing protein [Gammaproteobacteria bacterium]
MPLIRPFPGLRPAAGRGGEVLAPPYDVLDTEEAREQARGRPWSFLHISKPEIDFPPGTDPHDPAVYRKAAANLEAMIEAGVLAQDPGPRYYVYRLEIEGHRQTGLVAAAAADAYESNRIRKHEHTRPDKEDDRVRQIEALGVQTGPALLAYRARDEVDALIGEGARGEPVIDETDAGGVRHRLWAVEDPALLERLTGAFEALDGLYIADGHHRSAAAARLAARRRARNPRHTGAEAYNYFLAVIFPHAQMRILDYNRVVRDLNGLEP